MDSPEHSARFDDWLVVHRGIVFKVARSYAAQPADEAELVQEILVQLWRSASGFNGQCSVVTWIYRVSLNTALMWQRGQRRRHAVMASTPTPRTKCRLRSHARAGPRSRRSCWSSCTLRSDPCRRRSG